MPQSLRIFGAPPRIWSINALEDERSVSLEIGVRRWLLANPCAWIEEADAKATLDISDFQGFILRGYRMPMARHFLLTMGNCDAGHGGLMEVKITSNFRKPSEKSEVAAGRWDIANPERQMQRAAQYWPVLCRLRFRRSMPEEHDVWMRAPWNAARALQRQPDVL
jgi:hypothetical protein